MPSEHEKARPLDLEHVKLARELFWRDVVRQMLTSLSIMRHHDKTVFDGRMSVLTHAGDRLPIADVTPMFACSLTGSEAERQASMAVECTVFRIRTPNGEVFTVPLQEIRALHALGPELIEQLESHAMQSLEDQSSTSRGPFGFAAFRTEA